MEYDYKDKIFQVNTVRSALRYKVNRPDYSIGDELGITIPNRYIREYLSRRRTTYAAQDQWHIGNTVQFVEMREVDLESFVVDYIWEQGITCPRRHLIDKNPDFSKCVIVAFAYCGNKVVLIPRYHKSILSDVFTLTVMESATLDDMEIVFGEQVNLDRSFGVAPRNLSYEDPYCEVRVDDFRPMISRSLKEECPVLTEDKATFVGLVGGGKDFGVAFGVRCTEEELKQVIKATDGVSFDFGKYSYEDVAKYYGGRVDGWSEAILKYLHQRSI